MRPIILFSVLAALASLPVAHADPAAAAISPPALLEALERGEPPLVLDVRTLEEYRRGHVPGARRIPHDELAGRLAELGDVREVVVYCHSGRRAALAQGILHEAGVRTRQLEGNWVVWQQLGMPVETSRESPR